MKSSHPSARKAAICGLGGCGKTSLIVEYAHRKQGYYQGGVFWFSGEKEKRLENSVNGLALSIGTFVSNSFDVTLSQTLARISRIRKPWLLVIDDMDELQLSSNVRKVLCGSWQRESNGHVIVTTRRKPRALVNDVRELKESSCVELECFGVDDSKEFLFKRTGIPRNKNTETAATSLSEELGGLPLALEQAAAYIKSLGCSFPSYLDSYKAKRLSLLNEQRINPVSEYSSPERLAVETTWHLNIDYIRQNSEGRNAIRFLNACVFFNPDEIQEELINVGEPPVKDEQFRIFVGTSLGRHQIFKLLTDFSLFKQTSGQCLQVHRLVSDVIKESLTPREREESFVDAVRMLQHCFSNCFSPDKLLTCVVDKGRSSVNYTNPSLFYLWRKFSMHAGEIHKQLENVLLDRSNREERTVFLLETARIVYQYALYLSVFCKYEEAMLSVQLAYKILEWITEGESALSGDLNSFFPHVVPLPEFIRRHIQYCSKPPALASGTHEKCVDSSGKFEKLRVEGNRLFHNGRFQEAVGVYSSAIEAEGKAGSPDPRFFSNRASAYLKLRLYQKALEDANVYISKQPECWKGYARRALALYGLSDELGAELAASQTYFLFPEVFSQYEPFKKFSCLKQRTTFCDSDSTFWNALGSVMSFSRRIIFLSPGTYNILKCVPFNNCVILGSVIPCQDPRVRVKVHGSTGVFVQAKCAFANLDFQFDEGCCRCLPASVTMLYNCCFTSRNLKLPALQSSGKITVEKCNFRSSGAGGFLCCDGGTSVVEDCVFSNNGKAGLEVREGGTLWLEMFLHTTIDRVYLVGPKAAKCVLTDSQINCNAGEGIYLYEQENNGSELRNNSIFHNDHFGISVWNSSAIIVENRVFENSWWGIWLQSNSCCRIVKTRFRVIDWEVFALESDLVDGNQLSLSLIRFMIMLALDLFKPSMSLK